jgi:predicted MFS family arabinose efflux permease
MVLLWGGFYMQSVARGLLVYDITESSTILGLVSAGGNLPLGAFALFGGAIADRMDRKSLIQIGHGAIAVTRLVGAISITMGFVIWELLLVVSVLQGVFVAFVNPALHAITPQIVGQEKLGNAIALNTAALSTAALVAPAVGGVLYGIVGPGGVYYAITAMAFLSMALTISIPRPKDLVDPTVSPATTNMMSGILEGLSNVWLNPLLLALLAYGLVINHLANPFGFLLPVVVVDVYHQESEAYGLLISLMGLGALTGSLVVASLGGKWRGLILIMGSFASGTALLLVASVPLYTAGAAVLVVFGFGNAVHLTLSQTLVLENVEDRFRGRTTSIFTMNAALLPFSVLLVAFAFDALGARPTMGLLATGLLVTSMVVLTTQRRIRELN